MGINYFNGIYNSRKVLITGHNGFKGTWLTYWLGNLGADVYGLSLKEDRSHFDKLQPNVTSYFGDITNPEFVTDVMQTINPEIIFHLAAQSLVSESYLNPMLTYQTNVSGSLNLLESVRKSNQVKAVVMVTTDKVYENNEYIRRYNEKDALGGYDPYSSSKACVEILSQSYRRSFFESESKLLMATARAGNVIGGGDWAKDRLIPDLIRGIQEKKTTFIRKPYAFRPWQHVLEPLSGYLMVGQKLLEGNKDFATSWNFGPVPSTPVQVIKVIGKMKGELPVLKFQLNENDTTDFHESDTLILNCDKALKKLRWLPVWDLDDTINKTANWYRLFLEKNKLATANDLEQYLSDAREKKIIWCH